MSLIYIYIYIHTFFLMFWLESSFWWFLFSIFRSRCHFTFWMPTNNRSVRSMGKLCYRDTTGNGSNRWILCNYPLVLCCSSVAVLANFIDGCHEKLRWFTYYFDILRCSKIHQLIFHFADWRFLPKNCPKHRTSPRPWKLLTASRPGPKFGIDGDHPALESPPDPNETMGHF